MARQLFISSLDPGRGNFHYYHLPKGLITFSLQQLDNNEYEDAEGNTLHGSFALHVEKQIVPDPDHRYFLQYTNTGRSNDTVDVAFTEDGYLAKVGIATEDVTLKVIENIVDTVKQVISPTTKSVDPSAADFPVELLKVTIDPFDTEAMGTLIKDIQSVDPKFSMSFKSMAKTERQGLGAGDQYGILCKPMELCELKYTLRGTIKQELIQLPHPKVTHLISVPNAPFVKSTLNITFGQYCYPTNINIDQPSWWLAASQMPGKLLKGLVSLPAQLIQLRVNYMNDQTDVKSQLLEAQAKVKEQEAALKAANAKVEEKEQEEG